MADLEHDASGPASSEPAGIAPQQASLASYRASSGLNPASPFSYDRRKVRVFILHTRFFDRLGITKTFQRGMNAYNHPEFYRQIAKEQQEVVTAALALRRSGLVCVHRQPIPDLIPYCSRRFARGVPIRGWLGRMPLSALVAGRREGFLA